jgi:DNA-binding NarL/FixJ family response regulator
MPKDIHALLIEDDPFARDLMTMLLTRDWRTRVIGELGTESDVRDALENEFQKVDAIILDSEFPGDPEWPKRVAEIARETLEGPSILFTGNKPNPDTFRWAIENRFGGYVLKREIRYSLVAAVAAATKKERWVITSGVFSMALQHRLELPENTIIMDGTQPVARLTRREEEIARLAILFNHAHRDLADELLIRADQVAKHVSNIYSKLGLDEIIQGELNPEIFFEDKVILRHFEEILTRVANSPSKRKTADMATLAFHVLTLPEVREY